MTHEFPDLSDDLSLRHALRPGDLGRLISLHGELYADEPGFGIDFEAFVAQTVAEYGLANRLDGRIWFLERGSELLGTCAIAHRADGRAQLRWVLLHPDLRGTGLGRRLVELAIEYSRARGFRAVFLETTDGLEASSELYRRLGFHEVSNEVIDLWRGKRPLIRMEMEL